MGDSWAKAAFLAVGVDTQPFGFGNGNKIGL